MKKLILATAITAAFAANFAYAEEAKPDNEVSFNASVTSEYRYRGIAQTRLKPAVQGGIDFVNNPSGFYVGTWASTIKWIKDAGGDADVEIDVYGGKRGEFSKDGVTYDFGVLGYIYPSNKLKPSANTTEIYGQLGFGPAYIKYSHSTTNLFGFADSKGSGYIDIGANIELSEGLTLNLHAGHQQVKHSGAFSYTDYKVGLTKDFGFAVGSIAAIGTNVDTYLGPAPQSKNLGKATVVVALSKTF